MKKNKYLDLVAQRIWIFICLEPPRVKKWFIRQVQLKKPTKKFLWEIALVIFTANKPKNIKKAFVLNPPADAKKVLKKLQKIIRQHKADERKK